MPRQPDGTHRVSERLGCDVAGVTPPKRRAWINRGVLPQVDVAAGLNELQVIELALVALLHDVLGPADALVVWREVGDLVRDVIFSERLDLVVDAAWRECRLARSDAELSRAVTGGRLVRVISLAPVIKTTRGAFRRVARPTGAAQARGRRQIRRSTGGDSA
jgi:hypothetical protein